MLWNNFRSKENTVGEAFIRIEREFMGKQRINYLSLASVISAYAVVVLHANSVFWNFSTQSIWAVSNLIESVFYYAVPVFFMISGATLIDYRERYSTKEFFEKRIAKTMIPFLAWTGVGIAFIRLTQEMFPIPLNLQEWKEVALYILNNNYVGVYWFFTPLFCVYLCIPLFSAVEKSIRMKVFQYLVGIGFILNIALPFFESVFSLGYNNPLEVGVVGGYLIFVVLGYILNKQTLEKRWRMICYLLGIIGFLIQVIGTYNASMEAGYVVTLYKGYINLPCMLYATAVFVFIKEISSKIKNEKVWRFINWASKYTFAIYLMHWYVMVVLEKLFNINLYSVLYRLIGPIVICAVCILIAWIMRKIPVVKKIVP